MKMTSKRAKKRSCPRGVLSWSWSEDGKIKFEIGSYYGRWGAGAGREATMALIAVKPNNGHV
jgi:hypothetical protein